MNIATVLLDFALAYPAFLVGMIVVFMISYLLGGFRPLWSFETLIQWGVIGYLAALASQVTHGNTGVMLIVAATGMASYMLAGFIRHYHHPRYA